MDVDDYDAQITVDPRGIIGKQHSLHLIHLLDIIILIMYQIINY
jgi:hypothetical protein